MRKNRQSSTPKLRASKILAVDDIGIYDPDYIKKKPNDKPVNNPKPHHEGFIDPLTVIRQLFQDLGINHPEDMYMLDLHKVKRFTEYIGEPSILETRLEIISLLGLSIFFETHYTDEGAMINDFIDKHGKWTPVTAGIKVKDHDSEEGLFCPYCFREYHDSNELLLAQTFSTCNVIIHLNNEDEIKVSKPHVQLTPICPQCYCSTTDDNMTAETMINISPIIMGADGIRGMIPLLPLCFKDKMNPEHNDNSKMNPVLYWPKTDSDIICQEYITNAQHIEENVKDKGK